MTIVDPERDERGWAITDTRGTTPDPVNDFTFLSEAYVLSDDDFDGHVTVPVLWDRERGRIVNNESSEIIRMLDREFDAFAEAPELHYLPEELRSRDRRAQRVRLRERQRRRLPHRLRAHAERLRARLRPLFEALDELDARLATRRYLMGDRSPRPTGGCSRRSLRFDPVYVGHFKCNLRRIVDYPQLSGYLRELYQHPGIAETVDLDHIKRHYYRTHPTLNPMRIVPVGPALDLNAPHGREHWLARGRAATAVASILRPGTISWASTVTRAGYGSENVCLKASLKASKSPRSVR